MQDPRRRFAGAPPARRTRRPLPPRAESLERRMLLAITPAGPEFQANATTRGTQWQPAVAADADGDFVVVWHGTYQDATRGGVYARRFDRTGVPRGGDFRVNLTADTRGETPAVAMDADGDFVVAWSSPTPNGDSPTVVQARRYSAAGVAQGAPFAVAGGTTGVQRAPSIAVDNDGDFVVAWQNYELPSTVGIYARRFDSAGAARGDAFRVSTRTFGQTEASVAMDADGDFVVVWDNYDFGGEDWDTLQGRRYDAGGAALGDEFRVNVDPSPQPTDPVVAMDADGDFAVAWESYNAEGPVHIRARRFSAAGTGGEELHVSSAADGVQEHGPAVDLDADGDMVVAWNGGYNPEHVFARYYPVAGAAGAPVQVDTAGRGERDGVSVAADADGDFVVAWAAYQQETLPGHEVMARRFEATDDPPPARVVARHAFYNNSAFDGADPSAGARDDAAIATDKNALLANSRRMPAFDNVTSYEKGLNGVMVDVDNLPDGAVVTTEDFDFGGALRPASVTVRRGAGVNGTDRVTLIWTDYSPGAESGPETATMAVANGWLRITVKPTPSTGLTEPDVFSFANLIAETNGVPGPDGSLRVNALDVAAVKRALTTADVPLTTTADLNRDGRVNAFDIAAVKRNLTRALEMPPPAPAPESPTVIVADFAAADVVASPPWRRVADDVLG